MHEQNIYETYSHFSALQVYPNAKFGAGSGNILMDEVTCISNEASILDCAYRDSTSHDCKHTEDVGVVCEH